MKPIERTAITRHYWDITTKLGVHWDSLLGWLIQYEIIKFEDKEAVDLQKFSREKVTKMIDFVMHSDNPEAFIIFVEALGHTHPFLSAKILQTKEELHIMPPDQRPDPPSIKDTITCTLKRFNNCCSFGLTFNVGGQFDDSFFISDTDPYGIAAACGKLQIKDKIISVNKKLVKGMELEDVEELFTEATEVVLVVERHH